MPFSASSTSNSQYLNAPPAAPSRKRSELFPRLKDDVDEFLSSDLELSFASTMSLHSPPRATSAFTPDKERADLMDISPHPNPTFTLAPSLQKDETASKTKIRPRAFTSGARTFGRDMSNGFSSSPLLPTAIDPGGSQSSSKRLARSALPFEWLATAPSPKGPEDTNLFANPQEAISVQTAEDAMDVDTIVPGFYMKAEVLSSPPVSSTTTITTFNSLFYDTMSPKSSSSPTGPFPKKRRSYSPESVSHIAAHEDVSSPAPPSSPSQRKLERRSSGPLLSTFNKPSLQGLGAPPSNSNKRSRKPALSAMVSPSDTEPIQSAYPILTSNEKKAESRELPPPRRAFSAMLLPTGAEPPSDEGSSIDGPDMSSPAQAYAKRQSMKTIRRCDGTDDFRPLTGATAMVKRDMDESPSAKFLSAGMPGFGDNEALGKILPCHRVREDGLMRINSQTLDELLDGSYNSQIADYHIIDCRFDYEYNGGHIPGAVNMNTTSGVEDFLLGPALTKPKQSVSGDSAKKTVLVFHCEFSVKRAPTFAKHLRAKDRAMNNHVYPRIHYPEVYILEGGYCQYFKQSANRCEPSAYITMDDPCHALSRREDLDQFRKVKFGRTKSYAYGDGAVKPNMMSQHSQQLQKRNTAPTNSIFTTAGTVARTRRTGPLTTLAEDGITAAHSDGDETDDLGDSPCPPPTKTSALKGKRVGRVPLARAETYGPASMAY